MSHPTLQPAQTSGPSVVEMAVFVILFLWIVTLPSKQAALHRPTRPDHHLSSRLNSQFDSWMQSGFHGSPVAAVYRYLHVCITGPE